MVNVKDTSTVVITLKYSGDELNSERQAILVVVSVGVLVRSRFYKSGLVFVVGKQLLLSQSVGIRKLPASFGSRNFIEELV